MDACLEDFVWLLRQNGLRISPAEVADATGAALRATLVKRGPDAPIFDRLFELYFTGLKDLVVGVQRSLLDALAAERLSDLDLEEVAKALARLPLSPPAEALGVQELQRLSAATSPGPGKTVQIGRKTLKK